MKNNILKQIATYSILPIVLITLASCNPSEPTGPVDPNAKYYEKISDDLEGDNLKNTLNEVILHDTPIQYANLAYYYEKADKDPEKENHIILFYTGESVSTVPGDTDYHSYGTSDYTINREHVWPQSRFRIYGSLDGNYGKAENPGPATDLYNVRPAMNWVNTSRSNYFYGEDQNNNLYDPYTDTEGGLKEYRGEIARIIFYDATRYLKLEITDETSGKTYPKNESYQMGKISDLLKWNLEEAVNEREKSRNDYVQTVQGNRNPFVDHPEYACRIWGRYNNKTKQICGLK